MNPTEQADVVTREPSADRPTYVPLTDIYETGDAFHVVSEMPGIDQTRLEITLEDGLLTMVGTQPDETFEGYQLDWNGCPKGAYRRVLRIAADIDPDAIRATVRDGVVSVRLPKSEKAKPRKIEVTVN
jgi:HSP20 family molecular chaperone IbpA